jgi:transmembrane sensor
MQVQRQIDELLAHRASEWLEVLQTAGEAEKKEFAEWLSESRLHVQAFLEVAEIEYSLHGIDRARRHDIEVLLSTAAPNVVPLGRPPPAGLASEPDVIKSRPPSRRRAWHMTGLLAACVAIAAVALAIVYYPRGPEFTTAVGEQKTVELADMSVITLNALSKIEVNLEDAARDIQLVQGEALFTVAHDPDRPFKVHTRAGVVQAVGTQFNVYDRPNGDTRVSVLEGRVQLTARGSADGAASAPQILAVGEEADIHLDGTIQKNEKAVVADTIAWRARRLIFENATLEEMVAEFNRYNPSPQIRLEGIEPGEFRYGGTFDAVDPQSFIDSLAKDYDLRIERDGDEVVIRRIQVPQPE